MTCCTGEEECIVKEEEGARRRSEKISHERLFSFCTCISASAERSKMRRKSLGYFLVYLSSLMPSPADSFFVLFLPVTNASRPKRKQENDAPG
jgi:hypothetical protein